MMLRAGSGDLIDVPLNRVGLVAPGEGLSQSVGLAVTVH